MVKFGIYRVEDYDRPPTGPLGRLRVFLSKNRFSYQLLRTAVPPTPKDVARFEAIMHSMQLNSGIYRTTARNRFRDLDQFVNELLKSRFSAADDFEIQDWASSDCVTSVEWAASLFPLLPRVRLTASDLMLALVEVRLKDGGTFILQGGGEPLQYVRPPFVIRLGPPESKWLVINHLIGRRALAKLRSLNSELSILSGWLDSPADTCRTPSAELRKIPAVHPDAQALAARDRRFSIQRHSVFEKASQPADVIRTMNIFNHAYFPPERLATGLQAVWSSLKPGGLWIVGRTWRDDPPTHNATALERTPHGFEVVGNYGEGSEVVPIALGRTFSRDEPDPAIKVGVHR